MKKSTSTLPLFLISTAEESKRIERLRTSSHLRKMGARLYTSDMQRPLEELGREHRLEIVGKLCPGAVICYRSALERRPPEDGSIFVAGDYHRIVRLPGLIIRQVQGPGPLEGDVPYVNGLYMASRSRALLENLRPTKGRGLVSRSIGRSAVEELLAELVTRGGEAELNQARDHARRLATHLEAEDPLQILEEIIGGLLNSRPARLTSPAAVAVAKGEPYDTRRIARFEILGSTLRNTAFPSRPTRSMTQAAFANEAFFDAYFSNYIEGTKFTVDQALNIVFKNEMPQNRPKDAHDIRGTYEIVGNPVEMRRDYPTFDAFLSVLRARHTHIMHDRIEVSPGLFKSENNQAGSTLFVAPPLVLGTLRRGFEFLTSLQDPMARALFVMFVVAEVHPFNDGNGRVARAMMNGELLRADQTRIFIPSVFRNEYVGGLKRLTNHDDPSAFTRILEYAQRFVSRIRFEDLDQARDLLRRAWAFEDPADHVKLRMPDEDGVLDDSLPPEVGDPWAGLSDPTAAPS